jgi:hypothetical protein
LNDQVVRVTAGRQFSHVADDWDFQAQPFLPFAPDILSRLMALIEEVELPETKMALLNTVSVLVERLEHNVSSIYAKMTSANDIRSPLTPIGSSHYCRRSGISLGKNI